MKNLQLILYFMIKTMFFSVILGLRQGYLFLSPITKIVLDILASGIRQGKEINGIKLNIKK